MLNGEGGVYIHLEGRLTAEAKKRENGMSLVDPIVLLVGCRGFSRGGEVGLKIPV